MNYKVAITRIKNLFDRTKRLLISDCAKLDTLYLVLRIFKLIFLLLSEKKIIFNVNAKKSSFKFIFKPYKALGFGGRGQYLYREYYDRFFRVDLDTFNKNFQTFIDVGCSRGFFSVYLSKAYNCKTLSVDLYDYAIRDCKENFELNKIYGNFLKRAAIGSNEDNGNIIMLEKNEVPSRTSVLESIKTNHKNSNSISMISIDELIKSYGFNSFDLLKIDVEGYEYEVLKGSIKSIKKYRPIIYLEFSRKKYEILKIFNDINYLAFMPLANGKLISINKNDLERRLYENIFLVPKELGNHKSKIYLMS